MNADSRRLKIAVVWPKPRRHKWRLSLTNPDYPDLSDGLIFLEDHGIDVSIAETMPVPVNPLLNMHEFYSGLDPVRAAGVAMRAGSYDVIVCIGDATALFLIWLRRIFRFRAKIVLVDPALSPGYARRKRLQDFVIPQADHVVVYGRVQLDYLRGEYGAIPATFLFHRADTAFYRPLERPSQTATPYVYSVGLDMSRDFATFATAAQLCVTARSDHRFVLQTTQSVSGAPALDVQSTQVSYPELRKRYHDAALVVLPLHDSLHAGGINTLLEAMAMGKALVVSASKGLADYVMDGVTARVVRPGDAAAMSRAILDLLASPEAREKLGRNARQFVVGKCDNRVYATSFADVLRQALAREMDNVA